MPMPVPAMVYIPSRELVTPILIAPGCLFSRSGQRFWYLSFFAYLFRMHRCHSCDPSRMNNPTPIPIAFRELDRRAVGCRKNGWRDLLTTFLESFEK